MEGNLIEKDGDESRLEFCTLGMFIIDEIHFPPPLPPVYNVLGGAGSYSALGARLFSPPPSSKRVGWIVDAGSDFPPSIRGLIQSWQTSCLIRETPSRQTTRGWNGYGAGEQRAFRYLTPKLRLDHQSLPPAFLRSRSFHLICSPTRALELVEGVLAKRASINGSDHHDLPLVIWEPVPDLCTPDELPACYETMRHVDVVSPNHHELGGFFGQGAEHVSDEVDRSFVEECCAKWLDRGIGRDGGGAVVVRAGRVGCYLARRGMSTWLPAFHQPDSGKVHDPTGGGNAFLGGFAMGLVRGGSAPGVQNLEEAVMWGTVAASFAIEQIGVPHLGETSGEERWNGVRVQDRLHEFMETCRRYIHER